MFQSSKGVAKPVNQGRPANEGPSNTVINAAEVKFILTEYFDGEGRKTTDCVLQLGDAFYAPPNSQQWADALRGVSKWLQEGVRKKLPATGGVAISDAVDVTGQGG